MTKILSQLIDIAHYRSFFYCTSSIIQDISMSFKITSSHVILCLPHLLLNFQSPKFRFCSYRLVHLEVTQDIAKPSQATKSHLSSMCATCTSQIISNLVCMHSILACASQRDIHLVDVLPSGGLTFTHI